MITVEENPATVLDSRAPFGLRVLCSGDGQFFEIYVASGHMDRIETLPITDRHAEVLRADAVRYWFLFAALHHPFQLTATRLGPARLTEYLDTILFADEARVESFLTDLDHGTANGALSNLLRIFVDADYRRMREGTWFGSIPSLG